MLSSKVNKSPTAEENRAQTVSNQTQTCLALQGLSDVLGFDTKT